MSLQKDELRWEEIARVDLIEERIRFHSRGEENFSLEKIWPGFLFLKAMGFEAIEFFKPDATHISSWIHRIESYQQNFIEDPESILPEECVWNEMNEIDMSTLISCHQRVVKTESRATGLYVVPPMDAPLSVEPNALRAFLHEVDHQRDEDVLLRLQSILQEFRRDSKSVDSRLWTALVGDIIAVALEGRMIDKAASFAQEYRDSLQYLWEDTDRSLRIFAAYEPTKTSESQNWSHIFESLPLDRLIDFFKQHLGSNAGPQIIRLMSIRASQRPEEMMDFCFQAQRPVQKHLLQWLSPYWKPEYYHRIHKALIKELQQQSDPEMIQAWIQALFRSYKAEAYADLQKLFKPGNWGERFFSKKQKLNELGQQSIVAAIAEFPSAESYSLLKNIRTQVKGKTADEVERLIQSYKARGFQK